MTLLDMRTIIFSYTISNAICVAVMAFLWLQNHKRFAGLGFWLADFCMQFLALLLVILRGAIPDLVSMTGSNTLIIGGTILLYMGLERFTGKRVRQFPNVLLVLIFAIAHAYFVLIYPSLDVRNVILSLGLLAICSQCAWFLLRGMDAGLRHVTAGTGMVFVAFCLLSVGRIVVDLAVPSDNDFFDSNVYDSLIILTYQMLYIVLTFNLFLMLNNRLRAELERDIVERDQAKEALRLSEEKFFKAFHSSPDAIIISRVNDGRLVEVNEGFACITEYSRDEAIASSSINLRLWANIQDRDSFINSLQGSQRVQDHEYDFRTKSGKMKKGIFSGEIIQLGNEPHVLTVVRDATERKQMEESLHHQNDVLAALHQVMLDLVNRHEVEDILQTLLVKIGLLLDASDISFDLVENGDTLVTYAVSSNQPLLKGDRMHRGEGGWLSWQAVDTGQPAILEDYATWPQRRALFEGYPIHAIMIIPIQHRERVIGAINISRHKANYPFNDTDLYVAEQLAQMVALALDNAQVYAELHSQLAERQRIEESLRESRENFQRYFNMGTVGMCVTAPDRHWIEANARLCQMLGYTTGELDNLTWSELTHPDDLNADLDLYNQILANQRDSYQLDKRFIRKDGTLLYTSMFVSCYRNPDGTVRYFLASLVDITERKLAEESLLKLAAIGERQRLARDLHDSVNQSIHSLVLFSETLVSALAKNKIDRATQIAGRLEESARQALKETRLMLYEIQSSGPGSDVDLIQQLETRLATVERRAGVRARILHEGSIENCPQSWRENLFWITIEALNNALKHAQARNMKIVFRCAPRYIELEVVDDGIGFDPERPRAGGMGLRNMRERAGMLGGNLVIESTPEKGSCVRFVAEIEE